MKDTLYKNKLHKYFLSFLFIDEILIGEIN